MTTTTNGDQDNHDQQVAISTAKSVDPTSSSVAGAGAGAATSVVSLLTETGDPEDVTKFLALVETERIKAAEAAATARAAAAAAAATAAAAAAAYNTNLSMSGRGGGGAGKHGLYDAYGQGPGDVDEYGQSYDPNGGEYDGGEYEFRPPKRHKSSGGGGRKSAAGAAGAVSGGLASMVGGDDLYSDNQGLGLGLGDGQELIPRAAWLTNAESVYKAVARHAFVSPEKYRGEQVAADFFHPVLDMYPQLADEYLSVVSMPMDLTTLYYMIHDAR